MHLQLFDSALGGTSKMLFHFPLHPPPALFSFSLALKGEILPTDTDGETGKWYTSSREMEDPGTAYIDYAA